MNIGAMSMDHNRISMDQMCNLSNHHQTFVIIILGYSPGFGEEGHGKKKPMSHLLGQR
jgi:hypothetical protein